MNDENDARRVAARLHAALSAQLTGRGQEVPESMSSLCAAYEAMWPTRCAIGALPEEKRC